MIKELRKGLLILVPLLFATSLTHTRAANTGLVPPTISVSDTVGANPSTFYTRGLPQGNATVTWNAGTDYSYCEIYYTTNSANQAEIGRGHDGIKAITVQAGSSYEIWMVVYPGNGQYVIVTRIALVAKQGNPPGTPPPTGGGSPPAGTVDSVGDRPSELNSQAYRNAPFIQDLRVRPDNRNVIISFASNQSTPALVEIGKIAPAPDRAGIIAFPFNSGAFTRFVTPQGGRYTLNVDVQGEQLDIGTTYYYIINVFNSNRNDTKRPREQVTGQFNTLPQRVTIVWEKIYIQDDSDELSTGECIFWFWANYGQPAQKYTDYFNGDMDSGEDYNVNRSVVIDNAPDKLTLESSGEDLDDTALVSTSGARDYGPRPLKGAGDKGDNSQTLGPADGDTNAAAQDFDLSKLPGDYRTLNFRLQTSGGSLKFIVFGRIEITRGEALQTRSAETPVKTEHRVLPNGKETATKPPPVKVLGRVRLATETSPIATAPRSICDAARDARARNNPAAPGLEEKCRAITKGEALAKQDPLAMELRAQQAGGRGKDGFDSGMALAEGQTLPGPGKDKACGSLSSEQEQDGCFAAVLFSVERNRNAKFAERGAQIVRADSIAAAARNASRDVFYKLGFDLGLAVAEGQTLPGPGKDKFRDSLAPALRAGFQAAVLFTLDRNRRKLTSKG